MAVGGDLLASLVHLADDSAWSAGSHLGCAILRSPDVFSRFRITQPTRPSVRVAGCFAIGGGLLAEFWVPRVFYILALSKESVSFFRCANSQPEAVELPDRIPTTLAEAMDFEPPDHDLENRSASGGSAGARALHPLRYRVGTRDGAHSSC
jgi:hypothetical protein